jgi:CubicO group peptidase (beta-lactamase class C family)
MSLTPLPTQPTGTAWPTEEWPQGEPPPGLAGTTFSALLGEAFAAPSTERLGETHALLIVQQGRIVAERYGEGFGPEQTYPSWSKAKSITHALVGMAVGDGWIDVHAPADVAAWRAAGDPRAVITGPRT